MVTFTCQKCQWTGKKKQVNTHYYRCGGEFFICIDCGKSFASDYEQHTSCISEEDKYHGQWSKSKTKQKNRSEYKKKMNYKTKSNDCKNINNRSVKQNKNRKIDNSSKKRKLCEIETITGEIFNGNNDRINTVLPTKCGISSPSAKKLKLSNDSEKEANVSKKESIEQPSIVRLTSKQLRKKMKRILKNNKKGISLKQLSKEFNASDLNSKCESNNKKVFLETLWSLNETVSLNYSKKS